LVVQSCWEIFSFIQICALTCQDWSVLTFCCALCLQEHFVKEFKEPLNLKYIGNVNWSKSSVHQVACSLWKVRNDVGMMQLIWEGSWYAVTDPTYMIRAIPSNASDNVYCTLLAHSAIHGAMAGYCGFTVGPVNNRHCYIPISVSSTKEYFDDCTLCSRWSKGQLEGFCRAHNFCLYKICVHIKGYFVIWPFVDWGYM
jgi:6-phosphofructokinase